MHRKQAWSKRVKKERFKKKYLSRMQATRLLQVDSINFRRMCILKGVYPRAIGRSKQKVSGNEKQYYLAKEMKWMVRDQILSKIMAFKAWEKQVKRATAMQQKSDIERLHSDAVKPKYELIASIKERYPYFIDAVKDVDDALSLISLYAFLSPEVRSDTTIELHHSLPSGLHEKAQNVLNEWNDYVASAQLLSKSFISIKGYYYEALVKGERIRWLVPHEYAHKFPSGIQQYILITFLEFYVEMMRFVIFKLKADQDRDIADRERAEEEGLNANAEDFSTSNSAVTQPGAKKLETQDIELNRGRKLFRGLTFFISREIVTKHAMLVIRACGGRVTSEYSNTITHCVIDRPQLPPNMERFANVEYIQPQYLFDCLNARVVLPAAGYRIGEELPPHVSPFTVAISNFKEDVEAVEEAKKAHPKIVSYVPQRVHEIRKFVDPSYVSIDPTGKIDALNEDYSDDDEHAAAPEMDGDDDVSLSGDELADANRVPEWTEETVTENVERSKLSAYKVKKQRELNLMNAPTSENVAMRRQASAKDKEAKKKSETREQRVTRKLAQSEKQDRATKKMQLQVARKKAARYYKMVNSVVEGNRKKEEILGAKAKQLKEGHTQVDPAGKTLVKTKDVKRAAKRESQGKAPLPAKKGANPYKKLPKWVR
ncbi:Hypothetical protein, putative [Bodo saltans]|uniref:Pescadillo homolog n=1 Tax=Bodo saltans TaxID=75058 RepID=A0A0S4JN88_BODSA|nr:Hypothetical protein, putative [Bodo saltans]|eukprot:CUG91715.1 Hypothetical protein, putative [Bodo saltans]